MELEVFRSKNGSFINTHLVVGYGNLIFRRREKMLSVNANLTSSATTAITSFGKRRQSRRENTHSRKEREMMKGKSALKSQKNGREVGKEKILTIGGRRQEEL